MLFLSRAFDDREMAFLRHLGVALVIGSWLFLHFIKLPEYDMVRSVWLADHV